MSTLEDAARHALVAMRTTNAELTTLIPRLRQPAQRYIETCAIELREAIKHVETALKAVT